MVSKGKRKRTKEKTKKYYKKDRRGEYIGWGRGEARCRRDSEIR